jgi:hypothetical protein
MSGDQPDAQNHGDKVSAHAEIAMLEVTHL